MQDSSLCLSLSLCLFLPTTPPPVLPALLDSLSLVPPPQFGSLSVCLFLSLSLNMIQRVFSSYACTTGIWGKKASKVKKQLIMHEVLSFQQRPFSPFKLYTNIKHFKVYFASSNVRVPALLKQLTSKLLCILRRTCDVL